MKKADSAASHGLKCLALLGVDNWRGANDDGAVARGRATRGISTKCS